MDQKKNDKFVWDKAPYFAKQFPLQHQRQSSQPSSQQKKINREDLAQIKEAKFNAARAAQKR